MKLNKYDYELLDFLYHNNNSDLQEILNTFPENVYGTKYRLRILSNTVKHSKNDEDNYFSDLKNLKYENYIIEHSFEEALDDNSSFSSTNIFSLSSKGRKALIDYKLYAEELKKENKKKNLHSHVQTIVSIIIAIANLILAIKS